MVSTLQRGIKNKSDFYLNMKSASMGITGKMLAETSGLAKPESFTSFGRDKEKDEDIALMEGKLTKLEQDGFGEKRKRLIRKQILINLKKAKREKDLKNSK